MVLYIHSIKNDGGLLVVPPFQDLSFQVLSPLLHAEWQQYFGLYTPNTLTLIEESCEQFIIS